MNRSTAKRSAASWLALGVLGCGSTAPPPARPSVETVSTSAETVSTNANDDEVAAPVEPAPAPYEVHEWGFVDVPLGGPAEVGTGPGQPVPVVRPPGPHTVRKPVLYLHLDRGAGPLDVTVTARIPGGRGRGAASPPGATSRRGCSRTR
ncbi:MAG: hypothetical protein OHK0013_45490 [Sandaracinaceae bacterium]